jgi:phospholipase D1/2
MDINKKFERKSTIHNLYKEAITKFKVKLNPRPLENNFEAFTSDENYNNAKWLVDGKELFDSLYESLLKAKRTIYMAGQWITPELYLKRPVSKEFNEETTIIGILKKKAEEGVRIMILIYKEIRLTLNINSKHTKKILKNLHPNIIVIRHPKNSLTIKIWTHHEKFVVIDEVCAYIGGIDLCWGRYDFESHLIHEEPNEREIYYWPGVDYANDRIKNIPNVKDVQLDHIDRRKYPRMPWHDVATCLEGPIVKDLCLHFFQRWHFALSHKEKNTLKYSKIFINLVHLLNQVLEIKATRRPENMTCQALRSANHWSTGVDNELSIMKAYCDIIDNAKHYVLIQNQYFISRSFTYEEGKAAGIKHHSRRKIKNE